MTKHTPYFFLAGALSMAACSDPEPLARRDGSVDVVRDAAALDHAVVETSVPADAVAQTDVTSEARADASDCPSLAGDEGNGLFPTHCSCAPGSTRMCFPGAAANADRGQCRRGVQRCIGSGEIGQWSASCEGAINVAMERCEGSVDEDCDGVVDNGCGCAVGSSRACYSGAAGTSGVGRCRPGTETCAAGTPSAYGPCVGEVVPTAEVCGNSVDDDCDGSVDEGCTPTAPMCSDAGPRVENAAGGHVILANYDGGRVVIDVDVPTAQIGVIAYEPLDVVITGAAVASVTRVHITGYRASMATVSGVSAAIVERAELAAATLTDAAGNARMVCASTCRPGTSPGGCNTVDQVLHYFNATFGTARRWWHMQYNSFGGNTFSVSRGGCCV